MTPTTRPRVTSAAAAAITALAAALLGVPAHAAPPANDDIAGATPTTTSASTVTFDTTEATADPTDGRCVGDRSVWFRFVAPATSRFRLTTAGSSYDNRLAVFRGPRNSRSLVDCNNNGGPGRTAADSMRIREGEKYWIAISSCCEPGPGGSAVLTIKDHEGDHGVDLQVEGADAGAVSGRMFVFGSMTCATPSEVDVDAFASQRVGANVARGSGQRRNRLCGSDPVTWRVALDSETGWAFQPGPVAVTVSARAWDGFHRFGSDLGTTTVEAGSVDARRAP
jgi:hypothetical protein